MKIVHISDLHFPTRLNVLRLRRKSLIGYANYAFRRKKKHQLYRALIDSIQKMDYDCLIISGDITNVSNESEFAEAKKLLQPLLDDRAFLVPGNHDRYTLEALEKSYFEKYFGDFLGDPLPGVDTADSKLPYIRSKNFQGIALVGWDSNIPLPPMQAQGVVDSQVPKKTIQFLNESKIQEYMIVCHHPIWNPAERQESLRHRMLNRDEVLETLRERPPVAFFHGHLHTNWVKEPDEAVPFYVINSASSTRESDERHRSGYHILQREENSSEWTIRRMGYDKDKKEFLETKCINYKG